MKPTHLLLATLLALPGCAAPVPTGDAGARPVTVRGDVRVVDAPRYGLQGAAEAARVPYELRRLDHIDVYIRNLDDATDAGHQAGTLAYLGAGDAEHTFDPIVLRKLRPNAHYRVTLQAFQFDPAASTIVRVDDDTDGASETTFDTDAASLTGAANEEVTLPAGFALKLKDQAFSGRGAGDLSVSDGTLLAPDGAEELQPAE